MSNVKPGDMARGRMGHCPDSALRRIDPKADDTTDETHTNKEAETL